MNPVLLIAEDDERLGETLALEFKEREYDVVWIRSSQEFSALKNDKLDFALVDLRLKQDSGLDLITEIAEHFTKCRIVVLTGYGSIPTAVEAMKRGAVHYLTKPAQIDEIERVLWGEEGPAQDHQIDAPAETLAQHERDYIESVLLQCEGNISVAAKRLGIHRQSLQRKLRKFS
jgi:two-component system, response regulator RegA